MQPNKTCGEVWPVLRHFVFSPPQHIIEVNILNVKYILFVEQSIVKTVAAVIIRLCKLDVPEQDFYTTCELFDCFSAVNKYTHRPLYLVDLASINLDHRFLSELP